MHKFLCKVGAHEMEHVGTTKTRLGVELQVQKCKHCDRTKKYYDNKPEKK